ncbi:MAG: META domain-containing protein, partial [Bacteroidales bacterium]|nr:META domain-containing protein [Bacteroidales bacterium]
MKISILIAVVFLTISCSTTKETKPSNSSKEAITNTEDSKEINTQLRDAQLIEQGFDFVAFGNEPFWILRIDFDKNNAEFEQMNNPKYSFRTTNDDNNIIEEIEYHSKENNLRVIANEGPCYDNMNGEGFPYEITANINGEEMRGCGKYLGDNNSTGKININIYGTWMLRQLNDTILPLESKTRLNINNQLAISGFSSCNMYNGSYQIEKTSIKFKDILMTQMFCANSIEIEYM